MPYRHYTSLESLGQNALFDTLVDFSEKSFTLEHIDLNNLWIMKEKLTRLSIDVDEMEHRKIKMMAALYGKSIREFVIECVRKELSKQS